MQRQTAVGRYDGKILSFLMLLAMAAWANPVAAQKTDLVYLKNGDRITGEVKILERGRMTVKTHNLGTLSVEWEAVDRIVSDKSLEVELSDGRRILGEFVDAGDAETLVVERGDVSERLPVDEVARIDQVLIDRSFWQRVDGKMGLGVSYVKGSEVGQLYFNGNTRFREVKSEYQLNWNSILTSNGTGTDSERGNVGGVYRRYLQDRWFWAALANFDRNDELGIDARISAGGGGGRILRQRKDFQTSLVGGVVATRENTVAQGENDTNLEGIFVADLAWFKFSVPKTDFRTTLTIWPSITDWGRVRGNLDASLGQHVFTDDFSLDLTAFATYDNQPPTGAQKDDFGIITSLSYTF